MPKVKQEALEPDQRKELISHLEQIGRRTWKGQWRESMALPEELPIENRESIIRYLLLRSLLNQQGDTGKIREFVRELFARFGDTLLYQPDTVEQRFGDVLDIFREIGGRKGRELYRVGALGGIKPLSLFLYRFATFIFLVRNLPDGTGLYELSRSRLQDGVNSLWAFLREHSILEGGWVGNDPKAARMLTNWLVWLFVEKWRELDIDMRETLMVVDGHVGKVFCRTGVIEDVVYESGRPYVIVAKNMRGSIEKRVQSVPQVVPMFVDEGAFHVAMKWCFEASPDCTRCPVRSWCMAGQGSMEHQRWSAYQRFK